MTIFVIDLFEVINACGDDIENHTARYKDPEFRRGRRKLPVCERIKGWIAAKNHFEIWAWTGKDKNLLRLRCVIGKNETLSFPVVNEANLLCKGVLV